MSNKLEQLEKELEALKLEHEANEDLIETLKERQRELEDPRWGGRIGLISEKIEQIESQKKLEFWETLPELVPLPGLSDAELLSIKESRLLRKTAKRFYVVSADGHESYGTTEAYNNRDSFCFSAKVDRTKLP
jgi:hypothetical protein